MRNSVSPPVFNPRNVVATTRGEIDVFDWVDGLCGLLPHVGRPRVPKGAPLVVSGWAVDPTSDEPPAAVAVVLDDGPASPAESGLDRSDLRAELGPGTPQDIGFRAVVPIEHLTPGGHALHVYVLGADGAWYDAAERSFWVYASVKPGLEAHAGSARVFFDHVEDVPIAGPRGPLDGVVPQGDVAVVMGWAIDRDGERAPAGVCAIDAAGRTWSAPCDVRRADVRGAIGAATDYLGFEISIPTEALSRGPNRFALQAFDADGRRYGRSVAADFDVAAEMRSFPRFAHRTDERVDAMVLFTGSGQSTLLGPRAVMEWERGEVCSLEGWALVGEEPSAQIFLELRPPGAAMLPLRYQTISGFARKRSPRALPVPPRDDAWFAYAIDTSNLTPGTYALRIAVVRAGRCFYARGELGSVRVVEPAGSSPAARRL
ncbi:MAG: hypothetical protein JWO85_1483 [Candidatus Eremiobacteraeota bacterium]|nr:hypothetical protein [Candidatus Eremiobacteraeota bacterium]